MTADRTDRKLVLQDGRSLAYSEYGAPGGQPVFYFHGHPGSRRDFPAFDPGDIARELGVRIIAADRPGYGLSDFQPGRRMLDWPDDVCEPADALQLDTFAVLGISGGGPYAAACAYKIPQRLTATAIVCGMGPSEAPGVADGTAWKFAAGRGKFMRTIVLSLMSLGLRKKPEAFPPKMANALHGPDKALLLAIPSLADDITHLSFAEAFRDGMAGVHHEAGLYADDWGFRLADISAEVHLWHGVEDENVPVSVGRFVAAALPNCRADFLEDEGHLTLPYNEMRTFLKVLSR
ncbi:MAG: alpha/beta hydrolase [Deltaproteobacteria bacterium]|nr:MAG: alpha/beta hydrolase [Deltaproteobacteria bacterium]